MTTLLTGSTGTLGTVVLEHMLQNGQRGIRCLVRPGIDRPQFQMLRQKYGRGAVEIIHGNLIQPGDAERAVAGVERVVHLAASLRGAPADMFLNTVVGSSNLLNAVKRSTVRRLVLVSTLSVYELQGVSPKQMVDESVPLESHPEWRDVYTHTKIMQEQLLLRGPFRDELVLVVLRPGPLYGDTTPVLPARIGLHLSGCLLQLGVSAPLPLTYVTNCAEAVRLAAMDGRIVSGAYNVVDDDLPTVQEFVARYRSDIKRLPTFRIPHSVTLFLARLNEDMNKRWGPHVPQVLTRYRVHNLWGGHQYSNSRLKAVGWRQPMPTSNALNKAFTAWRA